MATSSDDWLTTVQLNRRFTAVLLDMPSVPSAARLAELAKFNDLRLVAAHEGWSFYAADVMLPQSLYPRQFANASGDGGYAHRVYLAEHKGRVLISVPYIRMLDSVRSRLGAAGLELGACYVDASRAFEVYAKASPRGTHVSQIVLSSSGVDQVEYISLSGKNPLRAGIHIKLFGIQGNDHTSPASDGPRFQPYGIAVKAPGGRAAFTMHANVLGHFVWFMRSEDQLEELGRILASLLDEEMLGHRPSWPARDSITLDASAGEGRE